MFGRGRLKITMKRHTACCVCQYCTSNSCPCAAKFETAGWRSHASGLGKKNFASKLWKTFFVIKKIAIRNQVFVKLFPLCFHLSAFEVTFIKTCNPALCWQKEFLFSLKIVHKWRSLSNPFPANHCSAFSSSHSLSCAVYSDDFSWQTSDEKLRKHQHFNQSKTCLLEKVFFQKSFYLKEDCHLKEKKIFGKKNIFCRKKIFWKKKIGKKVWNFFLTKKFFFTSGA